MISTRYSLIFSAIRLELERDCECDDEYGCPPSSHEVPEVGEHPVLGDDVGEDGVHVDALQDVEGEHGREEEVGADAHVAAGVLQEEKGYVGSEVGVAWDELRDRVARRLNPSIGMISFRLLQRPVDG